MDIGLTLPAYQKALQARAEAQPSIYNLRRLAPSVAGNKFAQNAQISVNISAKAQELTELLEASQPTLDLISGDRRAFLVEIEEKGLAEVLQSRISLDINGLGDALRSRDINLTT